jgi:hypothetical protein
VHNISPSFGYEKTDADPKGSMPVSSGGHIASSSKCAARLKSAVGWFTDYVMRQPTSLGLITANTESRRKNPGS